MKYRWTKKELENSTDKEILLSLIAERKSPLNPYSFLSQRLNKIYKKLNNKTNKYYGRIKN